MVETTGVFYGSPVESPPSALSGVSLPDEVSSHPLLEESAWVALRDSGIEPLEATEMVTTPESRAGFLYGAWLLDRSVKGGLLKNLKAQMLREVDVLAAGRYKNAIILPRRSSKTTTLWCVLLGRCFLEEMHMAGYSMLTTQKKTSERFRIDVYGPIVRKWPEAAERHAFAKGAPVKVIRSNGSERVEFENGSLLSILSPEGDAFRSGAYDTLVADEGGAASIAMGEDITSAVLPAFDTRPNGQFITAGTAAKYREGNILWDMLNDPKAGVLRFTVPDDIDPEELEAWEPDEEHPRARVREIVQGMHPGVDSGLTTLEKIEDNFRSFKREQFAEEYLGLFGEEGANSALIPQPAWLAVGTDAALPPVPEHFTWAVAVHPDGYWATIAAAWYGKDGIPEVGLQHHQADTRGLATKIILLAKKYPRVPFIYDQASQAVGHEMENVNRASPRPLLDPANSTDVKRGATKLLKAIKEGAIRHYHQAELDAAVEIAVKRPIGQAGGWGFGRPKKNLDADITPLEAISLALHRLEEPAKRQKVTDAILFR